MSYPAVCSAYIYIYIRIYIYMYTYIYKYVQDVMCMYQYLMYGFKGVLLKQCVSRFGNLDPILQKYWQYRLNSRSEGQQDRKLILLKVWEFLSLISLLFLSVYHWVSDMTVFSCLYLREQSWWVKLPNVPGEKSWVGFDLQNPDQKNLNGRYMIHP